LRWSNGKCASTRFEREQASQWIQLQSGVVQCGATDLSIEGCPGGEGSRREIAKGIPSGATRAVAKESTMGKDAAESKYTKGG
jgi:hypothetical protein